MTTLYDLQAAGLPVTDLTLGDPLTQGGQYGPHAGRRLSEFTTGENTPVLPVTLTWSSGPTAAQQNQARAILGPAFILSTDVRQEGDAVPIVSVEFGRTDANLYSSSAYSMKGNFYSVTGENRLLTEIRGRVVQNTTYQAVVMEVDGADVCQAVLFQGGDQALSPGGTPGVVASFDLTGEPGGGILLEDGKLYGIALRNTGGSLNFYASNAGEYGDDPAGVLDRITGRNIRTNSVPAVSSDYTYVTTASWHVQLVHQNVA